MNNGEALKAELREAIYKVGDKKWEEIEKLCLKKYKEKENRRKPSAGNIKHYREVK